MASQQAESPLSVDRSTEPPTKDGIGVRPHRSPVSLVDMMDGIGGVMAGGANVIMQLSWAPVGYGVLESKVDSGKVTKHPLKRARTTFTYLAVALLGTDEERQTYRKAVNSSHAQVRSGPDSPVKYNAFDPELQLWVAACLYYGAVDVATRFRGPMDDETADGFYEAAKPLGTTLQVKPEMWPADRAAFDKYWAEGLDRISIDPPVRQYLYDLAALKYMPAPIRRLQSRSNLFVTTGFLPPPFREAMELSWSAEDEQRFNQMIHRLAAVSRRLPAVLQRFPFNFFLWDFRLRVRFKRRLV
jgi:uncharacterized protein (DUF2236 family)